MEYRHDTLLDENSLGFIKINEFFFSAWLATINQVERGIVD
jgi:hypothetical protein